MWDNEYAFENGTSCTIIKNVPFKKSGFHLTDSLPTLYNLVPDNCDRKTVLLTKTDG